MDRPSSLKLGIQNPKLRERSGSIPMRNLERETNNNATARLVKGLMIRAGERHPSARGRGRKVTTDREKEIEVIRRMSRREQEEKRKSQRREKESSRRLLNEPIISSPRQKRARGEEGVWRTTLENSTNLEQEGTIDERASRAAYKQKLAKPGSTFIRAW